MKLKNKKTGEIIELPDGFFCSDNMKKICEEWEDYEEPKEYWMIDEHGKVYKIFVDSKYREEEKEIGNYFETREEAELAVRKLKAWKRLEEKIIDHVLKYEFDESTEDIHANISFSVESYPSVGNDLDLLFGGEE